MRDIINTYYLSHDVCKYLHEKRHKVISEMVMSVTGCSQDEVMEQLGTRFNINRSMSDGGLSFYYEDALVLFVTDFTSSTTLDKDFYFYAYEYWREEGTMSFLVDLP